MCKYNFVHKHPKVSGTFKALEIDGEVFVSWSDSKGRHMVEYTSDEAMDAIKKGDWIVV
jgi:hypothetical protein